MRLCRADYHGAYFKVTRAGCPSLVGLEGFVAAETRNTFQLVAKDNRKEINSRNWWHYLMRLLQVQSGSDLEDYLFTTIYCCIAVPTLF